MNNTAQLLQHHFDTAFAAPNGIKKLRELILTLAMQGKLVEQDDNDPPAPELLAQIQREKLASREGAKTRRKNQELPAISEAEKPYELPQGWEWVRLGDVFNFEYGDNLPADKRSNSGEFPVYGSNGIVGSHNVAFVKKCCIVIGRKGSAGALNLCLAEGCFVTDVAYYCIPPDEIDLYFCFNLLHILKLDTLGKGIKPGLNRNEAYELVIAIPPLPEQHRIVAKIDQLMARCDELERLRKQREDKRLAVHAAAIKQLLEPNLTASNLRAVAPSREPFGFLAQHFGELYTVKANVIELRKAILQLAVMGRLVPQDTNDPPASELLAEIQREKLASREGAKTRRKNQELPVMSEAEKPYELPQGWEWVRFAECYCCIGTKHNQIQATTYLEEGRCPVIDQGKNFIAGFTNETERLLKLNKPVVVFGDHTKNIKLIDFDFVIGADGVKVLQPYDAISSSYLYWLMRSFNLTDRGYARHFKVLNEQVAPLPPLPEQHRIVAEIDQLMALCDELEQQIDAAQQQQTRLLNSLMAEMVCV